MHANVPVGVVGGDEATLTFVVAHKHHMSDGMTRRGYAGQLTSRNESPAPSTRNDAISLVSSNTAYSTWLPSATV